jgi:hypothetical protein
LPRLSKIYLVLLVMASSTMFVSGAYAQRARLAAETARLRARTGAFAPARSEGIRNPAAPSYDVVVLRVEFQPDSTRFTTGEGTFAGALYAEGLEPTIDPLPHDIDYVGAHLAFLRDYVARVSDGNTVLRTHILPDVVRVSGRMGDYSPTGLEAGSDPELAKLAALVTEAWTLAAARPTTGLPDLDPERTVFMILHAGVGRDLELVGTILDKTPEDLPSLYMDAPSLDRLSPGSRPTIGGVPVRHGLIVPRTETRQGFNFLNDSSFLAEFSMNGLLAASFFNYLGVPDLFDTHTGASGIGPFGLMDGLGIFAYSGLFPPEPTAWTKYYLGWTNPTDLADGQTVELAYVGSESSDQARARISDAEYFLVENRQRDPEEDGVVLKVWNRGEVTEHRFENGAEGFNSATVDDFPGGVVVGVDQYDFALPGGLDEDGIPLVGGMLIWHVDERIIARSLSSNSVNADARRRGVDLEEADGAQDIGFPFGGIFGPSFDLGSPFDFFYEGNPVVTRTASGRDVRLYENRFAPDTHPASSPNGGGASSVELSDFSTPAALMSLTFRRVEDAGVSLVSEDRLQVPPSTFSGTGVVRRVGANGLLAFSGTTGALRLTADGQELASLSGLLEAEPAIAGEAIWAAGPEGFVRIAGNGNTSIAAPFPEGVVARATTPVLTIEAARGVSLALGATGSQGDVLLRTAGGTVQVQPQRSRVIGLARVGGLDLVLVMADGAVFEDRGIEWQYSRVQSQDLLRPQFGRDRNGVMGVVSDPASGLVHILAPDGSTETVAMDAFYQARGTVSAEPALADLDNDGLLDVLIADQESLWGFTRSGAVVNGFPIRTRGRVAGPAIVVDDAEDPDLFTILATAEDGQVDAYRSISRKAVPGFPLSLGAGAGIAPFYAAGAVTAVAANGYAATWTVAGLGKRRSGLPLGDASNSSFVEIEPVTTTLLDTPRLLVPNEVYNWPNPVREGVTRFRFIPTVDCSISVLIVDLAGNEVGKLTIEEAAAEVPSEVEWRTTAGSGLYFARIRATAADGRSEDSLVKVAIIR